MSRRPTAGRAGPRRAAGRVDTPRRTALSVLRQVTGVGAYANLALSEALAAHHLSGVDAALVTELVAGTCRGMGTYDAVIEAASGRALRTLQPAVVDVLRLATHQLLGMGTPAHAAVTTSVDLARVAIGERVTGVVNAVVRRIAAHDLDGWLDRITDDMDRDDALAMRTMHPRWIVDAWSEVLAPEELEPALAADNVPALTTLAVRPGLAERAELVDAGAEPTPFSPFGARRPGSPGDVPAVRQRRAGVQDEGSQIVTWALARATASPGAWLDLCAGPGGKSALLAGLAQRDGSWLVAAELQPHRAGLVAGAVGGYPRPLVQVVVADGTRPAWRKAAFTRVLADVPCSGLGALRRRPDARWRKLADDVEQLHALQCDLLRTALDSVEPGGLVAYVTCSPHRHETADVVTAVVGGRVDVEILDAPAQLPEVPDATAVTDPRFLQLWPHRHGTDAMFLALLRRRA